MTRVSARSGSIGGEEVTMAVHARRSWAEQRREEQARHPDVFEAYEAFKRAVRGGQRVSPERPMIPVERPDAVPSFASESEEHEYWGVHEMGDAFFEGGDADSEAGLPPPPAPVADRAGDWTR
jgi:hypothetical protein